MQFRNRIKWLFFLGSLVFGQLANYSNPDIPLWGKLAITGTTCLASGLILAANE